MGQTRVSVCLSCGFYSIQCFRHSLVTNSVYVYHQTLPISGRNHMGEGGGIE